MWRSIIKFPRVLYLQHLYSLYKKSSKDNRSIVKGMFSVAIFLLLAKLIAAGKEVVLAYSYGTSATLDGHLYAFNLASWPVGVFAAALWFGLTPAWVRLCEHSPELRDRVANELLALVFLLATLIALGTYVLLDWFILSGSTGLGQSAAGSARQSIFFTAVYAWFGMIAALYAIWLMSAQRHANTFLEAMPAVFVAGGVIIWLEVFPENLSVTPLNIGLVVGVVVQTIVLAGLCKIDGGFKLTLPSKNSPVWSLLPAVGMALLAQLIMASTTLVDTLVLGRMGDGALASYSYAQRVMSLAIGLTAMVIGRAVLPVFSAQLDRQASWAMAKYWAWRMFILGCIGVLCIAFLSKYAIAVLFERGAFSADDTERVAYLLTLLGIQLPFYMASTVWFNWLVAGGSHKAYLVMAMLGLIVKLVAVSLFSHLGAIGVAVSTTLVCLVHWLVVMRYARRAHLSLKISGN